MYNYMFQRLIMVIFRLYTKHVLSSYTNRMYVLYNCIIIVSFTT